MIYPVLEVHGLVNRFGSQVVHNGLSMEVREDEVFGIVGGSGTGKSVLLRSILGYSARRPGPSGWRAGTSPGCRLHSCAPSRRGTA